MQTATLTPRASASNAPSPLRRTAIAVAGPALIVVSVLVGLRGIAGPPRPRVPAAADGPAPRCAVVLAAALVPAGSIHRAGSRPAVEPVRDDRHAVRGRRAERLALADGQGPPRAL